MLDQQKIKKVNILELVDMLKKMKDSNPELEKKIEAEILQRFNTISDILLLGSQSEGLEILVYIKELLSKKLYDELYRFTLDVINILRKNSQLGTNV